MKAVLLTRRTADRAPGGDTLQLRETAHVLGRSGLAVRVASTPKEAIDALAPGDTLHLWNAQRPWDWGDAPEAARERGARVLLTPLLHPTDLYHREGRVGLDAAAARVVRDAERFASLRSGHWDTRRRVREVLALTDRVLLAHAREASMLEDWCGLLPERTSVVPPAIPAIDPEDVSPPFEDFVLCAGRIEPLKNPLATLRAARRLRLPVVFVGAQVPGRHLTHARRFRRGMGNGARWLGPVAPTHLRGLMRKARVHVLASWTEVLGRVTVEAALEGCAVVGTEVGHAPAYLGHAAGATWVPPGDDEALTSALAEAWRQGRPGDGALREAARSLLWEVVTPALVDAYRVH